MDPRLANPEGLPREERSIVAAAVDSRRREFAAGRILARRLLQSLGFDGPLKRNSDGTPVWPAGIFRSITHCATLATRSTCDEISLTQDIRKNANGIINGASRRYIARNETDLVVADPFTGEVKKKLHVPYPDNSAALTTGGGLFTTGFSISWFNRA
jgi:hypothetical protein